MTNSWNSTLALWARQLVEAVDADDPARVEFMCGHINYGCHKWADERARIQALEEPK